MKYITNLFIIFVFLAFSGCKSNEEELVNKYFFEMGTIVHVAIEAGKEEEYYKIVAFIKELTNKINNDQIKIGESRAGSKVSVSDEFIELYQYASKYYKMSNGIYDPTSITVSREYGFPDKPLSMPSQEALDKAKKAAGFENIKLEDGFIIKYADTYIDVSANSKGYIIDKTVEYMKEEGFKNFIVSAGGDLYTHGMKYGKLPYTISIEDPDKKGSAAEIIKLSNKAVATSGNYERYFITSDNKRITHIFSGVSFEPCNNYKSVSVIADTTEQADAYATLYFLSDIAEIKKYCNLNKTPVFIITLDNKRVKLCQWEEYER